MKKLLSIITTKKLAEKKPIMDQKEITNKNVLFIGFKHDMTCINYSPKLEHDKIRNKRSDIPLK